MWQVAELAGTRRNSVQNVSNNGAAHETSKDPRRLMRTAQVYFKGEGWGTPLQGGLEALRVLELVDCWGMLCIACSLPGLQVRKLPTKFVYIPRCTKVCGTLVPSLDGADRHSKPVVESNANSISGCMQHCIGRCMPCSHHLPSPAAPGLCGVPKPGAASSLSVGSAPTDRYTLRGRRGLDVGALLCNRVDTRARAACSTTACMPATKHDLLAVIVCCRGGSEMQWSPASPVLIHRR
jgi:hypothetical protein